MKSEKRTWQCKHWQKSLHISFKIYFNRLGVTIGKKPVYFLFIPLFISLLLCTGFHQLQYESDPNNIFTPRHGRGESERETAERYFPMNYSTSFSPSRIHHSGRFVRLLVTTQDGLTLFRQDVWNEIYELDLLVKDLKITHDDIDYSFEDLCARWIENCYENDVLQLTDFMSRIESGDIVLDYPITVLDGRTYSVPMIFGGIETTNVSTSGMIICKSVQALQLNYFLDADSPERNERGGMWEKDVMDQLEKAERENRWKWLKVDRFAGRSLEDEMNASTQSLPPYIITTVILMLVFAIGSCMMGWDWVRSKPWLGVLGCVTPILATAAAFGLLCYCGVPMICLNLAAVFLMLGIGMDDTFVILSAWRQTSIQDPVPQRLGQAYSDAAVSITMTSLTDMLSFLVGVFSPFRTMQLFALSTATAVLFTYIFHILFFGAGLALFGYLEEKNGHSLLCCFKTTPRSKFLKISASNSPGSARISLYKYFCTGGIDPADPHNPLNIPEQSLAIFFRDTWAPLLLRPWSKVIVLVLFVVYLAISCWGISHLQEGMELKRIAMEGGQLERFYDTQFQYFNEFPDRIQAIMSISKDFQFSNQKSRRQIEYFLNEMENTKFTKGGALYTESWLRAFQIFLEHSNNSALLIEGTEREFIKNLKLFLSTKEGEGYTLDVKLNDEESHILASRFILQSVNVTNWKDRRDLVLSLRSIVDSQLRLSSDMEITVHSPGFLFVDQFLIIRSSTIILLCSAIVVTMLVFVVFISSPLCWIWVVGAILSVEVGVVGFLGWWSVNLDVLSIIYLVMSVGFSVDFSAHIAYSYMSKDGETVEEKLRGCLYSMGLPILQGGISTILGVVCLAFAPSYDFVACFKAIFLVMVIAMGHGLVVIPVLLTIFDTHGKELENDNGEKKDGGEGTI